MPPNQGLHLFLREFRPLAGQFVFDQHRGGRGQTQGLVRVTLVFLPGPGNGLHVKFVFLAQPGQHFVEPLSGQTAGIVHKDPDLEQGASPFLLHFLLRPWQVYIILIYVYILI